MRSILKYINLKDHTFIKYIFSYLLIISVLFFGFIFIINRQLTNRFFTQQREQLQVQLADTAAWINSVFSHTIVLDDSLKDTLVSLPSFYKDPKRFHYKVHNELAKYDSGATMITSIVYKPENLEDVVTTQYIINYQNEKFLIQNYASSSTPCITEFDPAPYLNADNDQFILLNDTAGKYLLYFPIAKSLDRDIRFYILDINEITQQLKRIMSDEILSVALVDANGALVSDVNGSLLTPYMNSFSLTNGIHHLDASNSLCVQTGIYSDFALVALISQDSLTGNVNSAFYDSYLTLLILSIVTFMLLYFAMHMTYTPLKRLTNRLMPSDTSNHDHIKQLEMVFDNSQTHNRLLTRKLDNYRNFMQKSLFDTLISSDPENQTAVPLNIDQYFDMNSSNAFFVIRMMALSEDLPHRSIQASLQRALPGDNSCILLESESNSATFLINYIGTEQNKAAILTELLNTIYEEEGYLSAVSRASASPLDIPSLYENALQLSRYWPDTPMSVQSSSSAPATNFSYPSQMIQQLCVLLNEYKFKEARNLMSDIFQIMDTVSKETNRVSEFFIRCILIDVLTSIGNCMNKIEKKDDSYEELYMETLFFCRSCPYLDKMEEIKTNFSRLINMYEQIFSNMSLPFSQVLQIMEENYADPNFSIALLAEKCHISTAYMSYLFKKELNQGFSDYRWMLRLEKAKALLADTDMPIEEISIALGYLSPSGFQRKFKEEVGITPTQFRNTMRQTDNLS